MRHAKSSWATEGQLDHDRPLNKRGRTDAPRIAEALAAMGWAPDWVIASDSCRTRQTWAGMQTVLGADIGLLLDPGLYLAGLGALQESAAAWPASAQTVLALGHNPGWEQALGHLGESWGGMTTANAALLIGRGDSWSAALEGSWDLEAVLRPRDLDEPEA